MIVVTIQDGDLPLDTFQVSDEVRESLDRYRLSQVVPTPDGTGPKYATIRDMLVGIFTDVLVHPALGMFPPASMMAAIERVRAAQSALDSVKASVMGVLPAQRP